MSLKEKMRAQVRAAMKARNVVEREILRVALGEIETAESREGDDLKDAAIEKILRKLVKSNRETLSVIADAEKKATREAETAVLEGLLPKTLTQDEVVAALADVRDAILAAPGDGPATGIAMKHLKSAGANADGKTVSSAVRAMRA